MRGWPDGLSRMRRPDHPDPGHAGDVGLHPGCNPSILGGDPGLDSPKPVDSIVPAPRLALMLAGGSAEASPGNAILRSIIRTLTERWSRVRPQEILRLASAPTQGRFVPIDKL